MGQAAGNATEACRLAGYKGNANTLRVVGTQNLAKPAVRSAIEARVEEDPAVATREQLQRFWTDVALGKGEHAALEMRDRLKASELLGKSQAVFVEKVEHSGKVQVASALTDEQLGTEVARIMAQDPKAAEVFALAQKQGRPS
mgnify:FL=1